MASILAGSTESVVFLLDQGADVTIPEKDGYTPMHGAGFQGRADIAQVLIDRGLDPSDMHRDGFTPIHRAAWGTQKRHTQTVRVFLKAGVDPEEKSREGKVALDMTTNKATMKALIKAKAKRSEEL